ncbi:hypothetical protein [Cerasicoccus frondis]|uniref:hypothetical protein n=1 Tax=Cerasicoccus frondis TaxID=490090 RepID=UPI002852D13D|nr:hypothetical protein [Cerasicoccus frondis]
MKIYQILHLDVQILKTNPVQLHITAFGMASSTGWSNIRLSDADDRDPNDEVLELNFEGDPPASISLPVLTPVSASLVYDKDDSNRITAVVAKARTNEQTVHLSQVTQPRPQIAELTSQAFKTLAIGEEDPKTFFIRPEEGPTLPMGEDPRSTLPRFEELPTTFMVGEEGPITDPRIDDPFPPRLPNLPPWKTAAGEVPPEWIHRTGGNPGTFPGGPFGAF